MRSISLLSLFKKPLCCRHLDVRDCALLCIAPCLCHPCPPYNYHNILYKVKIAELKKYFELLFHFASELKLPFSFLII